MGKFYQYPAPDPITGDEIIVLYQDGVTKSGSLSSVMSDSGVIEISELGGVDNASMIAANEGDILKFNGGVWVATNNYMNVSYITTSTNAALNTLYAIDTSSVVSITLPATATAGDVIGFLDAKGLAQTNNPRIVYNGNAIMGLMEDLYLDINYESFDLVYINPTLGWRIVT